MPKNRFIHWGVLVLVASVLVWVGAELTRRVEWLLPYTAAAGVLLIVLGVFQEWRSRRGLAG